MIYELPIIIYNSYKNFFTANVLFERIKYYAYYSFVFTNNLYNFIA